ncbi:MAG: hypothetical protein WKG32_05590 [Gemmatimonadaceae bacterium]
MTPARAPNLNPDRFVSASELGEYAFCRRAWWLRAVRGATSEVQGRRFEAGHAAHRRHGAALRWARTLAAAAVAIALLAGALALWRALR